MQQITCESRAASKAFMLANLKWGCEMIQGRCSGMLPGHTCPELRASEAQGSASDGFKITHTETYQYTGAQADPQAAAIRGPNVVAKLTAPSQA